MRRNKPGLADLKKLRQEAQSPEAAPQPVTQPKRLARKRSPFLPPSASPSTGGGAAGGVTPGRGAAGRGAAAGTSPPASAPQAEPVSSQLSESDRKLFRSAVRYVEKIRDPGRVLLTPVPLAHESILQERRKRAAGLDTEKPTKRRGTGREAAAVPDAKKTAARTLSDAYVPATHDKDDSHYLKAGHGSDILRDLKRGKWPVGASLDLHGSNLEDARDRFERFLDSCLTHDVKCVRIVHGKGIGSRNGDAVLKATVRRWLTQVAEVIAYVECSEADGGAGAVQILLK